MPKARGRPAEGRRRGDAGGASRSGHGQGCPAALRRRLCRRRPRPPTSGEGSSSRRVHSSDRTKRTVGRGPCRLLGPPTTTTGCRHSMPLNEEAASMSAQATARIATSQRGTSAIWVTVSLTEANWCIAGGVAGRRMIVSAARRSKEAQEGILLCAEPGTAGGRVDRRSRDWTLDGLGATISGGVSCEGGASAFCGVKSELLEEVLTWGGGSVLGVPKEVS